MSRFLSGAREFKTRYHLSAFDYMKLILHYPFFKCCWLSQWGSGCLHKPATRVHPFIADHPCTITLSKTQNSFPLNIPFRKAEHESFMEIFWGNLYQLPPVTPPITSLVDLGANTGMASTYFFIHHRPARILAIEANPNLIPVIQRNLQPAQTLCRIDIENVCVSGIRTDDTEFFIHDDHRNSTMLTATGSNTPSARKILATTRPLRQLLDTHNLPQVDLLKMDIEGGEYDILLHDPDVFRRFRIIIAELHGERKKRDSFIHSLATLGFTLQTRMDHDESNCGNIIMQKDLN